MRFSHLTIPCLVSSYVYGSPVQKRSLQCEDGAYLKVGSLIPIYNDSARKAPPPLGLGNTTTTNHNGDKVKVLITTQDDGTPFDPSQSKFDFYRCSSDYMGTSTSDITGDYYGLLKPSGDAENCVQTKTGSVDTPDQVMVVAKCSTQDDSTQQQQTFRYRGRYSNLDFVSTRLGQNQHQHPTFFTLSDVNHHALKLRSGSDPGSVEGSVYLTYYGTST